MGTLDVELLPALSDNYVYLLRDRESGQVAVVDPAEASVVVDALAVRGWSLDLILNTHHHADHVGGNVELASRTGANVVGPEKERPRIPELDRGVRAGDTVVLGGSSAEVIEVPGHTSGHIAFWFAQASALFCGDALFSLGCGRMFEGTPTEMWQSLTRLRALPDDTLVYCGHEYSASNARFALSIDPDNTELQARADQIARLRSVGIATLPAVLGNEKRCNPFLRADDIDIAVRVGKAGERPEAVFAELRRRKDDF